MPFNDSLLDIDVIRRMREASDESPDLAYWVNPNVTGKEDIPLLINLYAEGMQNTLRLKTPV